MNKIKKILKWGAISVSSLIFLIIVLAIAFPSASPEDTAVKTDTPVAINPSSHEKIIQEEFEVVIPTEEKNVSENINKANQNTSSNDYQVVSVVDGDTVKVNINGKIETIRTIGLNTPETVDPGTPVEYFGKESSDKAKELLLGKNIILEADPSQGDRDKYGRLLRYIFLSDGRDFGKIMIAEGYAYEYTYDTAYKYQTSYKETQALAKIQQKGLWSENNTNSPTVTSNTDATTNTTPTPTPSSETSTEGKYYTSSASNSKKYYPQKCSAWENLSKTNLESFDSLSALLEVYPDKTLAEACK